MALAPPPPCPSAGLPDLKVAAATMERYRFTLDLEQNL